MEKESRGKAGKPTIYVVSLAVLFLLAGLFAGAYPVAAEPYLAVREGLKCDFCHVNKTGGGKRTEAFAPMAETVLHAYPLPAQVEEEAQAVTDKIGQRLSLGTNFRFTNTTLFRDDPDSQGRVENDQFFRPAEANDFAVDEGIAYLEADLIHDRLIFYLDESFAPGTATSREVFGLVQRLPWGAYLKAGRFFAPFGLRLQDDGAFTRTNTGFNFNTFSEGVEVGLSRGDFFLAAALVNSDSQLGDNTRKEFTANGYFLHHFGTLLRTVMAGASAATNPSTERDTYGVYGGICFWQLTLLAEGDLIVDDQDDLHALATHTELNWLALDRLNIKLAMDYFDPDDTVDEDQRTRYSFALEPFLYKYLQTRLIYRSVNDIPQNSSGNFNELVAELHVFF